MTITAIVGIPEDKDYLGVLEGLKGWAHKIIMTHAENDYLKFSEEQVDKGKMIVPLEFYPKVSEAMDRSIHESPSEGMILALGTQSFIRDVKTYFGQSTLNI